MSAHLFFIWFDYFKIRAHIIQVNMGSQDNLNWLLFFGIQCRSKGAQVSCYVKQYSCFKSISLGQIGPFLENGSIKAF